MYVRQLERKGIIPVTPLDSAGGLSPPPPRACGLKIGGG